MKTSFPQHSDKPVSECKLWSRRAILGLLLLAFAASAYADEAKADGLKEDRALRISWKDNMLSIQGDKIPGGAVRVWYIEAYCRPGSTNRDWGKTTVGHTTQFVSASEDGRRVELACALKDGVTVKHTITAKEDEIDFRLVADNPTDKSSEAHWGQPCMRVDKFTHTDNKDARKLYPPYLKKSFIFLDGKLARMPTAPWAQKARYTPGQVWCPKHVDRDDVNPRPLSKLVPSSGLIGCFSADEKMVLAMAWEPYQELFQGVITCLHSDFRVGGLAPGESKNIRGKIYLVPADVEALVKRYEKDFPEHSRRK